MSDEKISPPLTLSAEGSRARTLAKQTRKTSEDSTETEADSGLNMRGSFASYDPNTSSWRMFQLSLFGGLTEFSERWPSSGMMRNGQCFPRAHWVRHIHVSACSLWPTPTVNASHNLSRHGGPYPSQIARDSPCIATMLLSRGWHWSRVRETVELAMGFPTDWTLLPSEPSETP
jgi:hypothetical protein